jgi:5,6-dimethylbenzimidazole synthase
VEFHCDLSADTKAKIKTASTSANAKAAVLIGPERCLLYSTLKLEGILEAPINLRITCDCARSGPVGLGRTHNFDTDIY